MNSLIQQTSWKTGLPTLPWCEGVWNSKQELGGNQNVRESEKEKNLSS